MMYVYMYLGGALPVNSSVGIDRGEVGRGLAVARVNMPLCTGTQRQEREIGKRDGEYRLCPFCDCLHLPSDRKRECSLTKHE